MQSIKCNVDKIKKHSKFENVVLVLLVKTLEKRGITIANVLINKFNIKKTKYLQVLGHYKPAKYLPSSVSAPS